MSNLRVASIRTRKGNSPTLPDGAVITGVATATSFDGNLTGNSITINGNVTGDVTFSGDVSVGGSITYEDVTNVDSVGIITARDGIKIGAGQSVSAVSGTLTYYGDGSQLTGVESGVANFVASGTIPNGATVIINTDGTVSTVGTQNPSNINQVEFDSDKCYSTASVHIGSGKVVIAYSDAGNSRAGTVIVGTVSGSSISFGSPVVFDSNYVGDISIVYDPVNQKFVICWMRTSGLYDLVGSVSGTVPSLGSVQSRGGGSYPVLTYTDSGAGKIILAYGNQVKVGEISGTTMSWGSAIATGASSVNYNAITFDTTNDRLVVFYTGNSTTPPYKMKLRVGTLSGSNISFGSEIDINDNNCQQAMASITSASNSSPNIAVVSYYVFGSGTYITGVQLTPGGGNTISGGVTTVKWRSGQYTGNPAAPNLVTSDSSQELFTLTGDKTYYNEAVVAATGGGSGAPSITVNNTVTLSVTPPVYANQADRSTSVWVDTVDKTFYAFMDDSVGGSYATLIDQYSTTLTSENYIGIAAEAIADGATGKITIVTGINEGQTGLTTAQKYFVQPDGTLATSAGSPSVVAGTSISSTKIAVR